ncbi:claudin-23 [Varanus komodoensis]|uniref:claudin-23 n=1 Tax=Varanus komodoensis TaxID=61221 RepID=UPI001CF7CC30|nr:claudin-23 [Varanus komodoensis]
MRTPTVMIVGIVLGPCGLVLNLTSTLAPSWRTLSNIPHQPFDLVQHQGIWDICNKFQSTSTDKCNIQNTLGYFLQLPVKAAKVLMPSSLAVTLIGLVVSSLGVRCWQDIPNDLLAGLGGLLLFVSGILSLIAVSWYNYELYNLPFPADSTLQVSYCLVLGYLGSCLEIIGGISLTFSFARYCNKNRRRKAATDPPRHHPGPATAAAFAPSIDSRELYMHGQNPVPRSYSNSLDVLEDEWSINRSRLPCDSDL